MMYKQHKNKAEDEDISMTNSSSKYQIEGRIFRHSKLYNSYRQNRSVLGTVTDVKQKELSRISPSACDLGRQLLLHARAGNIDGVKELMIKGAPFTTDWLGMSALHFAVLNNHEKMCDLLLYGGINKDGRTKVDRTPLHFAVYHGYETIIRLLLEKKCDVNARDMLKMTPLHWAVEKNYKSIVRMLLRHGAEVLCVSKFNKTPICIATGNNDLDLVEELNLIKEKQNLENSLIDTAKLESETNQAVKSITSKTDKSEYTKCLSSKERQQQQCHEYDFKNTKNTVIQRSTSNESLNSSISLHNDKSNDSYENQESTKYVEPIIQLEKVSSEDSRNESEASVLDMLKSHGISMLPCDDDLAANNFVSSALKSGRKFVLSEAGKLVLNEAKLKNKCEFDSENVIERKSTLLKENANSDKIENFIQRKVFKRKISINSKPKKEHIKNEEENYEFFSSEEEANEDLSNSSNIEICHDIENNVKEGAIRSSSNRDTLKESDMKRNQYSTSSQPHVKVYSNKILTPIDKSNKRRKLNVEENLFLNSRQSPEKVVITKVQANIQKKPNVIPAFNITELIRQMCELKKQVEELKKNNEEFRQRIDKLENGYNNID